jgi:hypothetical protein
MQTNQRKPIASPFAPLTCGILLLAGIFFPLWNAAALAGTVTSITWLTAQTQTGESATYVAAGPDGNVWATEQAMGQIFKIDPTTGAVTRFALPASTVPFQITAGPDGNLWFSANQPGSAGTTVGVIGKITTSGNITIFPYPDPRAFLIYLSGPIAGSSDGSVYVGNTSASKIGKINPATGAVSEIPLPTPGGGVWDMNALSDGSVVIAELFVMKLARLANGVIHETPLPIPGFSLASPTGAAGCTIHGSLGICIADGQGFQDNFVEECTLSGNCTPYTIQANQCSAQKIDCSGDDCLEPTPFCQEVVHVDTSVTPPGSNIIAGPLGYNTSDIKFLGATGKVALTASDPASNDFHVFIGTVVTPNCPPGTVTLTGASLIEGRNGGGVFGNNPGIYTASGGTPPYSLEIDGDVPPGVSISQPSQGNIYAGGNFTNVPEGGYIFTLTVTDANGCTAYLVVTWHEYGPRAFAALPQSSLRDVNRR